MIERTPEAWWLAGTVPYDVCVCARDESAEGNTFPVESFSMLWLRVYQVLSKSYRSDDTYRRHFIQPL